MRFRIGSRCCFFGASRAMRHYDDDGLFLEKQRGVRSSSSSSFVSHTS